MIVTRPAVTAVAPRPRVAPPSPRIGTLTWPQAVDLFIRDLELKGYSSYTRRDYRTDVMRLGALLDVSPGDVGEEHLEAADAVLAADGVPADVRRRRGSAWRRFLAFLAACARPLLGPRLIAAAWREPAHDRLLVGLVFFAGLRLSEVASLEGRDVRRRRGDLVSRSGWRIVPMHPWLDEQIEEEKHRQPLAAYRPVVPGPQGYAVNARTLHSRFSRCAARLGHPELRPEALRREASELLARMGTPPGLVQAFLGKDRGRPLAPRRGRLVDLSCLRQRIAKLPTSGGEEAAMAALPRR